MGKNIVIGNWKMNGNRVEALSLASEINEMVNDELRKQVGIIIAPSFVHLASISQLLIESKVQIAAQNCSSESEGAFTGEISAEMISSVGATHVIIGHSERRSIFNEDHKTLKDKIDRAHEKGLTVIFCIGEKIEERKSNNYKKIVLNQLLDSLFLADNVNTENTIIAYEPVWAIGTGVNAKPQEAQEMHAYIRSVISEKYTDMSDKFSILYGGSCNESNAGELFSQNDIDGGLIGGASLNSRSFINIINSFD